MRHTRRDRITGHIRNLRDLIDDVPSYEQYDIEFIVFELNQEVDKLAKTLEEMDKENE